jgi:hypothetical protein
MNKFVWLASGWHGDGVNVPDHSGNVHIRKTGMVMKLRYLVILLSILALGLYSSTAHADGEVTVCDEANLLAALSGGGLVTFSCSGVITLSSVLNIDEDTVVDASGQNMRDNRIKRDWLESATYPLATFVATAVENFPANYVEGTEATFLLLGDLTIRNITIPATFEVTATLADGTITGTAVAPLTMTDFGFDPPAMLGLFTVADDFRVEITFTATE